MAANDRIILSQYLETRRLAVAPEMPPGAFFTIFVAEQTLKNYDLAYDEILQGLVDGGNDGGVDAAYCFVDNDLVHDDFDSSGYRGNPDIELVLIQTKQATGFNEDAINRLISTSNRLLNLEIDLDSDEITQRYNAPLLARLRMFREAYRALIAQLPQLTVSIYYATEGDEVHPNVRGKVDELKSVLAELFSASRLDFQFLGAAELLALARRRPTTTLTMRISETIATSEKANVSLVPLPELFQLLSDGQGRLRKDLFEANVRDYQGSTSVNRDIAETLLRPLREDFWWLNNGITILATQTALAGKTLTLENVQIVNGLQTCAEIHKYCASHRDQLHLETRQVLVRVIVPDSESSRDLIIKATNSQTSIPLVSLRATEKLQRDIEDYFKTRGLFYDRRKNYYKNEGKPVADIISIPFLAQAVTAIFLQEPDNSRARPSTLLKTDDAYNRVFDDTRPVAFYLACAVFMRKCESVLRQNLSPEMRNNFRFHFAMLASLCIAESRSPNVAAIIELADKTIPDDMALKLLGYVMWAFETLFDQMGTLDRIAKSSAATETLKWRLPELTRVVRGEEPPWYDLLDT